MFVYQASSSKGEKICAEPFLLHACISTFLYSCSSVFFLIPMIVIWEQNTISITLCVEAIERFNPKLHFHVNVSNNPVVGAANQRLCSLYPFSAYGIILAYALKRQKENIFKWHVTTMELLVLYSWGERRNLINRLYTRGPHPRTHFTLHPHTQGD